MAGIAARPVDGLGSPETLPWAKAGTTLEPSLAQEASGWLPDPAPAPDYRLENWHRNKLSGWLERLGASALFVGSPVKQCAIGGDADAGDHRRLTINAHPAIDYITVGGDTNTTISQAFVALINASAAGADVIALNPGAGGFDLIGRKPGTDFTAVAAVIADVGVANATFVVNGVAGAPFAVRLAEDWPADLDFNFAPNQALDTAAKTFHFRQAKAAFRAGEFTGNAWDNSNTGAHSAAFGKNTVGLGAFSFAAGEGSQALSTRGVALGGGVAGATAGATGTVAIGYAAAADGERATALGDATASARGAVALGGVLGAGDSGANASGEKSVAVGANASAIAASATAVGNGATATATESTAIGAAALATAVDAVALGSNAQASKAGALAMAGALAQGINAVAMGQSAGGTASVGAVNVAGTLAAMGGNPQGESDIAIGQGTETLAPAGEKGAVAIGRGDGSAKVSASGKGALATGGPAGTSADYNVEAYGDGARAHGSSVRAEAAYTAATGQGALAETRGERAHSAVAVLVTGDPVTGGAQHGDCHFVADVDGATDTVLDPANSNPADTVIVRGAAFVEIDVVALWLSGGGGATGDSAAWRIMGLLRRDAGNLAIVTNLTCIKDTAGVFTVNLVDASLIDADAAVTIPPYAETTGGQFTLKAEIDGSYLKLIGAGTVNQLSRFSAVMRYTRVQNR